MTCYLQTKGIIRSCMNLLMQGMIVLSSSQLTSCGISAPKNTIEAKLAGESKETVVTTLTAASDAAGTQAQLTGSYFSASRKLKARLNLDDKSTKDINLDIKSATSASFTMPEGVAGKIKTIDVLRVSRVLASFPFETKKETTNVLITGAPAVTSATAVVASNSATWTWTSGGNGSGTFRYKLDSTDLTTGATSGTALTYSATGLSDGAHTLYVQEQGSSGTWSASGSYAVTVDTSAPTVIAVTSPSADGHYKQGDIIPVTVQFSEIVIVTGSPTLALNTSATLASPTGSGSNTLSFNYTVGAGQTSADLNYSATSSLTAGTSIKDAAGNNAVLTLPALGVAASLGGSKALVIDTTAPLAPDITVATSTFGASFTTTITQNATTDTNFKEIRYNLSATAPGCASGTVYSGAITIPAATTTLTAVSCDFAGNVSASTQSVYL